MPRQLLSGGKTISIKWSRKRLDHKMDRILFFIASTEPCSKKTIERKLRPKVDKPTIYKAIRRLLDEKQVVIVRRERNGLMKYYDLTRLGIMNVVLFAYEEAGEDAAEIIEFVKKLFTRYPEWLPGIASLWPTIEEASAEELQYLKTKPMTSLKALVTYALVSICEDHVADAIRRENGVINHPLEDPVSALLLAFTDLEYGDKEYAARWLMAAQGNPILREATTKAVKQRLEEYVSKMNKISEILNATPTERARLLAYTERELKRSAEELDELKMRGHAIGSTPSQAP